MKKQWLGMILFTGFVASVHAQDDCPGTVRQSAAQIEALVSDQTLCAMRGNERWQEWHEDGGQGDSGPLWDYKRGPNSTGDPSQRVGSWQIIDNPGDDDDTLVHSYGNNSYPWTVCRGGSFLPTYTLVGVGQLVSGIDFEGPGLVPCP